MPSQSLQEPDDFPSYDSDAVATSAEQPPSGEAPAEEEEEEAAAAEEPANEAEAPADEAEEPAGEAEEPAVEAEAMAAAAPLPTPEPAGVEPMFVICGPSGVGKGTLIEQLVKDHPSKFGFCVSHTSRAPRGDEQDGQHYHFTSQEAMEEAVEAGEFLEHASVHGNLYGTSAAAVQAVADSGRVPVLDIDVQGAQKVGPAKSNTQIIHLADIHIRTSLREKMKSILIC